MLEYPEEKPRLKEGFWSYVDKNPLIMAILMVLILYLSMVVLTLAITDIYFMGAMLSLILALGFHSYPKKMNLIDFYLNQITHVDKSELNLHDAKILEKNTLILSKWVHAQAIIGLCLIAVSFFPTDIFSIAIVILSILGFIFFGFSFKIWKGVYASKLVK
jgi:hypothetical protein